MIVFQNHNLEWYQYSKWQAYKHLFHAITTRKGGYSQDNYASLNLGNKSGDDLQLISKNREKLRSTVKIPKIYFPDQCHTANSVVVTHENSNSRFKSTDALITAEPNICIGVLTADCIPVLLFDPEKRVVAAIHGGWRGIIKGIVQATIEKMSTTFNCNPKNLIAGIGPSISQQNYEVGPEVVQAYKTNYRNSTNLLSKENKKGHAFLNLWDATFQQLAEAGLQDVNIETAKMCTYTMKDSFFSARRDGYNTGRFASLIMLTD